MSIRTLYHEAFHVWAADRGIGRDPRDPESAHLSFVDGRGGRASWPYPDKASDVPHFAGTLLAAVRPNDRFWVYPERGVWSLGRDAESCPEARVWTTTVRALGVPAGLRGAIGFNSTDWNALTAMLFLQITLGASVGVDTIVIPENGKAVFYFDRGRVAWGTFRDEPIRVAAVAAMRGAGHHAAAEAPADAFAPVPSMAGGSEGARDGA